MKASDILAHLKVRLKDIDVSSSTIAGTGSGDSSISQSYLLDLIAFHQNELLAEFEYNVAFFEKELNNESEVEIDFEINKLIAALLNGQTLNLTSYASAIRQQLTNAFFIFEKSPKIYGFSQAVSGKFQLYAVKKAVLTSADDDMILPKEFTTLLTMSVFCDIMRGQVSPDNTTKLDYYYKIVENERQKMIAATNRKRSKNVIFSPFVKA